MTKRSLAKRSRDIRHLEKAWQIIRANGRHSQSNNTRIEVEEFSQVAGTGLRRIRSQLRKGNFKFPAALGIPIDRGANKSRRPIVKSPVASRIVQRSIHDCLLEISEVRKLIENPNSFGGVTKRDDEGRGAVPAAISETVKLIECGAKYFIRSDIESFFTKIPKPAVLDIINRYVTDGESRNLVRDAIYIELENMAKLRRRGFDALFPIEDIGVAQGNCLSPLLGNILLSQFDEEMNSGDCRCLRYIDDFIILGPDRRTVRQQFRAANEYLRRFQMRAYDPRTETGKADHGNVSAGFDFLGINLKNGSIRPTRNSRRRLIRRIEEVFRESIDAMEKISSEQLHTRHSLTHTMSIVSGIAKGWAEQYSYCNERNVFRTLDRVIDKKLAAYLGRYSDIRSANANNDVQRRLLGVTLLTDSEATMIRWGGEA